MRRYVYGKHGSAGKNLSRDSIATIRHGHLITHVYDIKDIDGIIGALSKATPAVSSSCTALWAPCFRQLPSAASCCFCLGPARGGCSGDAVPPELLHQHPSCRFASGHVSVQRTPQYGLGQLHQRHQRQLQMFAPFFYYESSCQGEASAGRVEHAQCVLYVWVLYYTTSSARLWWCCSSAFPSLPTWSFYQVKRGY